nr:Chain G, SIV V2 peptide [Simian immunodeficiency virus]
KFTMTGLKRDKTKEYN